ncbi:hypothetical protein C8Q73DRAFT_224169 [Cubamyces lactineus]|nr:hypothetical protein C8Q73DRAFT_224169 [Cubamyces lactineus]
MHSHPRLSHLASALLSPPLGFSHPQGLRPRSVPRARGALGEGVSPLPTARSALRARVAGFPRAIPTLPPRTYAELSQSLSVSLSPCRVPPSPRLLSRTHARMNRMARKNFPTNDVSPEPRTLPHLIPSIPSPIFPDHHHTIFIFIFIFASALFYSSHASFHCALLSQPSHSPAAAASAPASASFPRIALHCLLVYTSYTRPGADATPHWILVLIVYPPIHLTIIVIVA